MPKAPVQRNEEREESTKQLKGKNPPSLNLTASPVQAKAAPVQRKSAEEKTLDKVKQYDSYIEEASATYGIPVAQIRSIIAVESNGNASASSGAAWGLMQVTKGTWADTQKRFPELKKYDFNTYWSNPRINIMFGTATFKQKMKTVGVGLDDPNFASLAITAYNAGEGTVRKAITNAKAGGSKNPTADCLKAEYLKPAIQATRIYRYYLTGGGKKWNKSGTVEEAVALKYKEVSRYPTKVEKYLALQKGEQETSTQKDTGNTKSENGAPIASGYVKASALNVRTGPGGSYGKAGSPLKKGAKVTIYGEEDGWYNIGDNRYVSAKYIIKEENKKDEAGGGDSGVIDSGTIIAGALNVRKGPNASYATNGKALKKGAKVQVLEKKDGWLRIGEDKWVSGKFVELGSQVKDQGDGSGGGAPATKQGHVTASALNVRSGIGTKNAVVRKLSRNDMVTIYETKGGWVRIGDSEWVSGDFIKEGKPAKVSTGKGKGPKPSWISIAEGEIGQKEIKGAKHNKRVLEYHSTTGKFGTDEVPWCASFANWVMGKAGKGGTGSALAMSFKNYGKKLKKPAYGSLAVFSYGGGKGHVGFVVGKQGSRLLVLGGNQSDSVKISSFSTSKIVAYVVPGDYEVPAEAYNLDGTTGEFEETGGLAATR